MTSMFKMGKGLLTSRFFRSATIDAYGLRDPAY